jgi:hypothetical protein
VSPNEQKVTPGRAAISSARSISSSGVTHRAAGVVFVVDLDYLSGDAEAHRETQGEGTGGFSQLSRAAATTNCPKHSPPSPGGTSA